MASFLSMNSQQRQRHYQRLVMLPLLVALFCLSTKFIGVAASKSDKTWTLYHAWKGHDFSKRGHVRLTLLASNEQGEATTGNTPTLVVQNDHEVAKDLAYDDLYQLKLVEDGTKNQVYTITSVPACQMHRANFRDEITMTLNNRASVISMAHVPLVSPLAPSCSELQQTSSSSNNTKKQFSTKALLETATQGMVLPAVLPQSKPPPGLVFLKSSSSSSSSSKNGIPLDEENANMGGPQGFIKKYWYIILPLFIMSMTTGGGGGGEVADGEAAPHPSQAAAAAVATGTAGGATPSGPAAAATTTAPSSSSSARGGAQRRRGKRG